MKFEEICHEADICIVGGGLSGLCAGVAAARHGASVIIMQDRHVLGGNASSEIRMWVCGAHGENKRETGIIEELMLDNQYYNPDKNYSVWDSVIHGLAVKQSGLELLLNCACMDGVMDGNRLVSVKGFQSTTQVFHTVKALIFIDCSGDSVLIPITGAPYRSGREAEGEFSESIAPKTADKKTMGMSCLIQAREEAWESDFTAPAWAKNITHADLEPYRVPDMANPMENFWYLELGGENDAIKDTETLRNELLSEALGLWNYIKNAPENKEKNKYWHLDWIGFLPGKRESRRYIGDYILTQNDIESEGKFDDVIAYGGWTMDDHNPAGIKTHEQPTVYNPAPSPFGIPYRCIYSSTIDNLMFAGRNISVTHSALSATRVMATCATLGQAAGTAAAMAVHKNVTPRIIGAEYINELKQQLMTDDSWLPFDRRMVSPLTQKAHFRVNGAADYTLANGFDRPIHGDDNGVHVNTGDAVTISFDTPEHITGLRIVFDSDLNRYTLPEHAMHLERPMPCNRSRAWRGSCVPMTITRSFEVQCLDGDHWKTVFTENENHQRLVFTKFDCVTDCLRIIPHSTWGAKDAHIFSVDLLN